MKDTIPYIHRDISWLSFNYRVLQEAKDKNVPLLERLKFLSIYSSNLDEFFKVRVANHKNLVRAGKKTFKKLEFEPREILKQVLKIVTEQQKEFSKIFEDQIIPELKEEGINVLRRKHLSDANLIFITNYYHEYIRPYVQPILLKEKKIRPFLQNNALYLAIYMKQKDKNNSNKYYALARIPSDVIPRFIEIPSKKKRSQELIILDDIIRENVKTLFPGFDILDSYSIKLTRDAELYIDDEYSGDLVEKIKKGLNKRKVGTAARLVYDRKMPEHFLKYLMNVFDLQDIDLLAEGRYHNNSDFMKFPGFKKSYLKDIKLSPINYTPLSEAKSIFDAIEKKDHLLYFPYHSYASVTHLFQEAAVDDRVTHIRILQYRVAKESKIMDALIKAVKNGKQVTAFVEVKARFDEKANLEWGQRLEAAGVNVIYSMPGLKVHAKMAMVRRVVNGEEKIYTYLGTGNFNENTAKLYTDFGYFTVKPAIVSEALQIFYYLETKIKPTTPFENLAVGTFNLKLKLKKLIQNEIKAAEQGKEAYIILKMNSLQDMEMISLLYQASNAGVKIKMIIRGICCLLPQIKSKSENINAYSIVDRFLEHARVFIFCNSGDELIYLSSADWMVRNLHYRIETMFPILDDDLKHFVKTIINIQLNDNVKSRYHDLKKNNEYRRSSGLPIRSQLDTYYFVKRSLERQNQI